MATKLNDEIKSMFNKISKNYDFMNNLISLGTHKHIKKLAIAKLNIKPNSKVLDLCCGTGDLGGIIKKMNPTCDVIGVDYSSEMLDIARKKYPQITYWEMDALNLAFEKNYFDYIVIGFGLRNIPEKNKAIEEIYRVLKSNGKVMHLDFGKHNFISKIYDLYVLTIVKFFTKNTKPYKYLILSKNNFLEPNELIDLFKFNRLKCIKQKDFMFDTISSQIYEKNYN